MDRDSNIGNPQSLGQVGALSYVRVYMHTPTHPLTHLYTHTCPNDDGGRYVFGPSALPSSDLSSSLSGIWVNVWILLIVSESSRLCAYVGFIVSAFRGVRVRGLKLKVAVRGWG